MGRGDKRTKKGKIKAASYGIARSHAKPKPAKKEKVKLIFAKEEPVVATTVKPTKSKSSSSEDTAEESVA